MTNERDTHFAGFAQLLFDDLYPMFNNLLIEESDGTPRAHEAERTRQGIKEVLAESAYDLARHVVWEAMGGTPNAITIILSDVPDLTTWPETPTPFLLDRATWPAKDDKQ